MTSRPAFAWLAAIPPPMLPRPMNATRVMDTSSDLRPTWACGTCRRTGRCGRGARRRTRPWCGRRPGWRSTLLSPSNLKPAASTVFFTAAGSMRCRVLAVGTTSAPGAAAWSSTMKTPPGLIVVVDRLHGRRRVEVRARGQVEVVVVLRGPEHVDRLGQLEAAGARSATTVMLPYCGSAAIALDRRRRRWRWRGRRVGHGVDLALRARRPWRRCG